MASEDRSYSKTVATHTSGARARLPQGKALADRTVAAQAAHVYAGRAAGVVRAARCPAKPSTQALGEVVGIAERSQVDTSNRTPKPTER